MFEVNMGMDFSDSVRIVLKEASSFAYDMGAGEVGTEHLLFGLASVPKSVAAQVLNTFNVTAEKIRKEIKKLQDGFLRKEKPSVDFSPRVKETFKIAQSIAFDLDEDFLMSEHLLYALLADPSSQAVIMLSRIFGVNIEQMKKVLSRSFTGAPISSMFDDFEELESAFGFPKSAGGFFNILFPNSDAKKTTVMQASPDSRSNAYEQARGSVVQKQAVDINAALPEVLRDLGSDMTARARVGKMDPIIGRSDETNRIIEILCRKTKNNPVLIGEAGVGKSAVVEGLAQAIVRGNVPEILKNKIIFSFEIGSLMAGTKFRGSMEEKLKVAVDTIIKSQNIIVFIDEIHMLAQAGSKDGEVSPADMLKPYLARGELQTIGATTTEEYRKFIEKDRALERRFQPIIVNQPTEEDTIKILKGLRDSYEAFHKVKITDEAIEAAVNLSVRYIMDRFLPDKAIDLMDEASSRAKVLMSVAPKDFKELETELKQYENQKKEALLAEDYRRAEDLKEKLADVRERIKKVQEGFSNAPKEYPVISAEDVARVVAKWTGIPVSKLTETERERLLKLEEELHKSVIGQDEAVTVVSRAIRRARAGLKDPKRPIGTFIFLGPTGVGKTELTKAIAKAMFDDENNIVRLDMSEYMEPHSVAKLIGSPPGYVGHDDGGQLTKQVQRKPYSVVLFDEIEKAHPDVFNVLLQMLDEGRLTDSQGQTISFKNTIIILTSNVGVADLPKNTAKLGFNEDKGSADSSVKERLMNALKAKFKPEFLNRIDATVIFNYLSEEDILKIAKIMINGLNKKLSARNIELSFTKKAIEELTRLGFDKVYGARPLKRVIEQQIEDRLAEELLSGRVVDGNKLSVDFGEKEFNFKVKTDKK